MSKKRSPRDVCSMTDGMTRFDGWFIPWLLTAGGPEFRLCLWLFLVGRPDRLARLREVLRDALHLGDDAVECVAQAHVLAQRLEAAALAQPLERLVGVLVEQLRLLAHERHDLVVGDGDTERVGGGLEHELARDGAARLL